MLNTLQSQNKPENLGETLPFYLDLCLERVLLAKIPFTKLTTTSFLDERALDSNTPKEWIGLKEFASFSEAIRTGSQTYLMHLGHSGSTLLSRLIEKAANVRTLREPLPLRTFAFDASQNLDGAAYLSRPERLKLLALFENVWANGAPVLIKTSSVCNDLADDFNKNSKLAFVYVKPEIYLTALLGGANAKTDLRGFGQMRLRRFNSTSPWRQRLAELSPGQLAAMCWLTETTSIITSNRKIHYTDFDKFLTSPENELSGICDALSLTAPTQKVTDALTSPIMHHYSKDQSQPYDANYRKKVLAAAYQDMKSEIQTGLHWLKTAATEWKVAEVAINQFS